MFDVRYQHDVQHEIRKLYCISIGFVQQIFFSFFSHELLPNATFDIDLD